MPWPMRLGRAEHDDLLAVVGSPRTRPRRSSTCRAVLVANSAAQVSTRLYTGRTLSCLRSSRMALSLVCSSLARRGRKSLALERAQRRRVQRLKRAVRPLLHQLVELELDLHDLLDLHQNHLSIFVSSCTRRPRGHAEGVAHVPDALGPGSASSFSSTSRSVVSGSGRHADFQAAQRLLERLLEGAPMAITSPTNFICVVRRSLASLNFSKAKRGILGRRSRSKARTTRVAPPGDVVAQFVQRVAHRQLGRDLGDREAGGLGGQCRGARHARVHLDHDHAARRPC